MRHRKCFLGNAFACLFVFSLIFVVAIPAVADVARGADQQLSGVYFPSDQQEEEFPSGRMEFSQSSWRRAGSKGTYSITGDMIELVHDGKVEVHKFSSTKNTIMLTEGSRTTTYVRATSERLAAIDAAIKARGDKRKEDKARNVEEAHKAGFIVASGLSMTLGEAKAFCQQQGGRLPLINDMTKWDGSNPPMKNISIDGFGTAGSPWPSDLPSGYWTGTEDPDFPDGWWFVGRIDFKTHLFSGNSNTSYRSKVVCVPRNAHEAETMRKAAEVRKAEEARLAEAERKEEERKAEAARKTEEARKAAEARKAEEAEARKATEEALRADGGRKLKELGFTALSESRMNWADANAFCQQKGGRLPYVNNSELFTRSDRDKTIHIDGFGAEGRPWAEVGLPRGYEYWTGTEYSDNHRFSWFVYARDGKVFITEGVGYYNKFNGLRVVCVPPLAAHEAEKMRKAEEARNAEAEAAFKAAGFIAVSETTMSWNDAQAFCRQKGGRLPLINGRDKFSYVSSSDATIESFGKLGDSWPSNLPRGLYWTGAEDPEKPGHSRMVEELYGKIDTPHAEQSSVCRVVCVPLAAGGDAVSAPAASETATPVPTTASPTDPVAASTSEAAPRQNVTASPTPSYPPLTAADGKLKAATHLVRLENGAVELALQVLAPGKTLEAIRIDNLGGISSLWRSDGKDGGAPLSVSQGGNSLSSGAQAMNLALGEAETLLALSLKDNGAFSGKSTELRVTVFFTDGERAMCALGTKR